MTNIKDIEILFEELKALHSQVFPNGNTFGRYSDIARQKLEHEFMVKFILLCSHVEFINNSIRQILKKMDEYQDDEIGPYIFQYSANSYFLTMHESGASLCDKVGPLKDASSVYALRKHYRTYLEWNKLDEYRKEKQRKNDLLLITPVFQGRITEQVEHENDENSKFWEEEEEDVEFLSDQFSEQSDVASEYSLNNGMRVVGREPFLSNEHLFQVRQASQEFFNLSKIKDLTRKRLGVWGAFYLERDGTYTHSGDLATTYGYAKEAHRLGLGKPAVVGDALNRGLGVAKGYCDDLDESRRKSVTLMDTFFQQKGWADSDDDDLEKKLWKMLLAKAFRGDLARIALVYITQQGMEVNVPMDGASTKSYEDNND